MAQLTAGVVINRFLWKDGATHVAVVAYSTYGLYVSCMKFSRENARRRWKELKALGYTEILPVCHLDVEAIIDDDDVVATTLRAMTPTIKEGTGLGDGTV